MLRFETAPNIVRHIEQADEDNTHFYIEVQFHDQVRLDEIEELIFFDGSPEKRLADRLKAEGIPWRVVP